MIELTKFHGHTFVVNADLIEFVESIPETVIVTAHGRRVIVSETVAEVVEKVIAYRQRCLNLPKTGGESPNPEEDSPTDGQ